MLKNWCFWTVVLEKTLESPLTAKIKLVNPKGNQSWLFILRMVAEAETPILWSPDMKNWLIGKDTDAGKDWRQKKGTTEDGWDGWMASLTWWTWVWASSRSWWWRAAWHATVHEAAESGMTEWLNWTEMKVFLQIWVTIVHSFISWFLT